MMGYEDKTMLFEGVEKWCEQYLHYRSFPPLDGEFTAGELLNRFVHHVILHNVREVNISVENDISNQLDSDRDLYKITQKRQNNSAKQFLADIPLSSRIKLKRSLSQHLERSHIVSFAGDRRGRLYRNKSTRPKISAKDVAIYISWVMAATNQEFSIRNLGDYACSWAKSLHQHLEDGKHLEEIHEDSKLVVPVSSTYLTDQGKFPFTFIEPKVRSNYEGIFNSDLLQWCENVYNEEWYQSNVPNVLRYLRKEFNCIAVGSKKGMWIHKSHIEGKNQPTEVGLNDLFAFSNEFANLKNRLSLEKDKNILKIKYQQLEGELKLMMMTLHDTMDSIFHDGSARSGGRQDFDEDIKDEILDATYESFEQALQMFTNNQMQGALGDGEFSRTRDKIRKFLADRPRNTAEILEHINSTMRRGITSEQLDSILSKDGEILKVGHRKRSGNLSGGYDIEEWATRIWVADNIPDWKEDDTHSNKQEETVSTESGD